MNHKLIFTVAAMAVAVVFPGSAIAQARVNQFTDKRVSGASGPVTRANFAQFVASSGFPITRGSDDSHYTFTVQVAGKPTTFSAWLLDELTPSRISITAPLLTLKDEASVPAWVTQRLLIANNNNAPVFFAFSNCTSNSSMRMSEGSRHRILAAIPMRGPSKPISIGSVIIRTGATAQQTRKRSTAERKTIRFPGSLTRNTQLARSSTGSRNR